MIQKIIDTLPKGYTFTVQELFDSKIWTYVRGAGIQGNLGIYFHSAYKTGIITGIKVNKAATSTTATVYEKL